MGSHVGRMIGVCGQRYGRGTALRVVLFRVGGWRALFGFKFDEHRTNFENLSGLTAEESLRLPWRSAPRLWLGLQEPYPRQTPTS
jgi:hypothetical protein